MTFKDIFPGLSRTKVIFQDFPGGVGTLWLLVWFILAEFGLLPISIIYWQCTCVPLPSPHLTGHEDDGLYKNLCQIAVTASRYFQMWKGRLTPYKPSTSSKAELLPQNWTCRATNKHTHTHKQTHRHNLHLICTNKSTETHSLAAAYQKSTDVVTYRSRSLTSAMLLSWESKITNRQLYTQQKIETIWYHFFSYSDRYFPSFHQLHWQICTSLTISK